MRYFAMIDGERRGPFGLDELADAGVRPDTYVWCKGMSDWEKAESRIYAGSTGNVFSI